MRRQARDLRRAAGDEGRDAVVAEAEAVAYAGGDGDDVLQRAAELHSYYIIVGIDGEARVAEFLLDCGGESRVGRGDGEGSGLAERYFTGEGGSAEGSNAG